MLEIDVVKNEERGNGSLTGSIQKCHIGCNCRRHQVFGRDAQCSFYNTYKETGTVYEMDSSFSQLSQDPRVCSTPRYAAEYIGAKYKSNVV